MSQQISQAKVPKLYEKFMYVVGIGGQLALYIQAHHIFSTESARDVSLLAFSCFLISVTSWLIYGLFKKDRVLVVSNIVAVIGACLVVVGILKYSV